MGIDARILVRVNEGQATDDKLQAAEHWLFELFGLSQFSIYRDRILTRAPTLEEDAPDERAQPGKVFVEVAIWTRYYSKGYERGDFAFIYMLARALEHIFTGGQVFYGGDCGVGVEPFDPEARDALFEHWLTVGHRPYHREISFQGTSETSSPTCRRCGVPMLQYGSGPAFASFSCPCGEVRERHGTVETVTTERERQLAMQKRKADLLEAIKDRCPDLKGQVLDAFDGLHRA
jgi:hypothetical protein